MLPNCAEEFASFDRSLSPDLWYTGTYALLWSSYLVLLLNNFLFINPISDDSPFFKVLDKVVNV